MAATTGPRKHRAREVCSDPDAAARRIEAIRTRHRLPDHLVDFLWERLAEVPDPDRAVRNLETLCRRTAPPAERDHLVRLLLLFGLSQFLADVLLQNPELVDWLGRDASLDAPKTRDDLVQDLARFHFRFTTRGDRTVLRQFKDREYLRIALRDCLQSAEVTETTAELSDLADVLLDKALTLTEQGLAARHGRPQYIDAQGKLAAAGFTVVALGKLGGRELNYSSDIDLLFLYSEEGETAGDPGGASTPIANREWFTRLAAGIVERISTVGPAGHVFRIDMELRPGGRDGELTQSLRSALAYYQVWGRGWERQALLKARPAAGDPALGRAFLAGIDRIIHAPGLPPVSAAEAVGIHRQRQERLDAEEAARDLKNGPGGIRELELSVQALQLSHSGPEPWLREGNTLRALHRLSDKGYISTDQHEVLARAYCFLRRVEHRLQLPANRRTFRLPKDRGGLRILARAMGYRDGARQREGERFRSDLEAHRRSIRAFYRSVLEPPETAAAVAGVPDLLLDPLGEEELRRGMEEAGFGGSGPALRSLISIRQALLPFRDRAAVAARLRRATPEILRVLAAAPNPLRGWKNLERFLSSLARAPERLQRFLDGWRDRIPVFHLLARSDLMADLLVHRPQELDPVPTGPEILRPRGRREMSRAIRAAVATGGGPQAVPPVLCRARRQELLRIGFRDLQGRRGIGAVQRSLADLAEAIVAEALYVATAEVQGRRRVRRRGPAGLAVFALGRLATREMGYLSDLDLLFLREPPPGSSFPFHQEHTRVAERLIQILSTITQHGFLYEVDVRLRPSGGEGELIPTVDHLERYFEHGAEIWERQSFLRCRPVAGDPETGERAMRRMARHLFIDLPPAAVAGPIADARARLQEKAPDGAGRIDLKLGRGGLIEILFLLQYLQLTTRRPVTPAADPPALLVAFRRDGILNDSDYRALLAGYRFCRNLEHCVQLVTGRRSADCLFSEVLFDELAVVMDAGGGERLRMRLEARRDAVRAVYDSILLGKRPG